MTKRKKEWIISVVLVFFFFATLFSLFYAKRFFPLFFALLFVSILIKFLKSELNLKEMGKRFFNKRSLFFLVVFFLILGFSLPGIMFARLRSPYKSEREISSSAYFILSNGDFNPHRFDRPAGYTYFQAALFALYFLEEASRGRWTSIYQAEPADFLLLGRLANLLLLLAFIFLFYRFSKKVLIKWMGYLPLAFLVFIPLVIRSCFFINPYPLFTLFTLYAFYFLVDINEGARSLFIAPIFIGLAAGCDYAGFLLFLPALIPLFRLKGDSRGRKIALFFLISLAVFFLINPYLLIARGEAVADLGQRLFEHHNRIASGLSPSAVFSSLYHGLSLGPVLTILVLGTAFYAIFSVDKTVLFYLIFPLAYLPFRRLDLSGEGVFLLPVIPFLLIATTLVWQNWLAGKLALAYLLRRVKLAVAFSMGFILLIVFPLAATVRTSIEMTRGGLLSASTSRLLREVDEQGGIALAEFPLRAPGEVRVEHSSFIPRHSLDFYIREGYRFLILLSDVNGDFPERFGEEAEIEKRFVVSGSYPYPRLSLAILVLPGYQPLKLLAPSSALFDSKGKFQVDFKRRNLGVLGKGWGDVSSYNDIPGRFAVSRESFLFLPQIDQAVEFELEVAPVVYKGSPPQLITVSVNGMRVKELLLPPENKFRRFIFSLPPDSLHRRVNIIGFNHRFLADPRGYLVGGTPIWGRDRRAAFYLRFIVRRKGR